MNDGYARKLKLRMFNMKNRRIQPIFMKYEGYQTSGNLT
jgi:hypothetical protein